MPGSIPASATGEAAPDAWVTDTWATGAGARPRRLLPVLLHRPAGLLAVGLVTVITGTALVGPLLAPYDPFAATATPLTSPSAAHLLGTDGLGRDVWSGVLYGARTSVLVAGVVAALVLAVGLLVGSTAGYVGGRVDDLLMRTTEFVQVLPRFFLAIVVIALFGPGLDRLVVVLGLTSWPLLTRVVRAEVLSLRHREFVEAARADGASPLRIVTRELLPNVLTSTVVVLGLLVAQVMLVEASLSFLGLGDPNVMSLGYLASEGQDFLRVAWWLAVFPGVAVVVAVLAFNLLGDVLTDALRGDR